jgi:hypothetical protein
MQRLKLAVMAWDALLDYKRDAVKELQVQKKHLITSQN